MSNRNRPKKRNKPYRGPDAADARPVVHRYTAVKRSPISEWWLTRKGLVKIAGITVGGVTLIVWFIVEALRIIL